jgi:hypothetical protein
MLDVGFKVSKRFVGPKSIKITSAFFRQIEVGTYMSNLKEVSLLISELKSFQ